ncbi:MAG: SBBP repeat-containing protein, partial [Bryobacteraceae bacterium]
GGAPNSTADPENALLAVASTSPGTDVFAVKLDLDGNLVYSTHFGGSANDTAAAAALGADGSLYVSGATTSADFPVTPGAYATVRPGTAGSSSSYLFKLNPDGSTGWSTYFADFRTTVSSMAVDSAGNAYVGGSSAGNLPTTPGVYQTDFKQSILCPGIVPCIGGPLSAFVTKFNAQGSGLLYSTYVSVDANKYPLTAARALAVDPGGRAWFGGQGYLVGLNAAGSVLFAVTTQRGISVSALTLDSASNVYATGTFTPDYNMSESRYVFPSTPGAFQSEPQLGFRVLPGQQPPGGSAEAFVMKWNSNLSQILAATLLGGELADSGESIAVDPAGNTIISGKTDSKTFPIHSPFQTSFSPRSGFVASLDPGLSQLRFSTYLGDRQPFDATAVALDGRGNLLVAGTALTAGSEFLGGQPGASFTEGGLIVANKISLSPAPVVRLDSVVNFASRLAAPIAPGESVLAMGSGFGSDAQLVINGVPLTRVAGTGTTLIAVIPGTATTSGDLQIQVSTGGALSNPVFVPAAPASPGIYALDANGYGQGYILNSDGTLNSPANPAATGSAITIFATGSGVFTVTNGYAVTALPPAVFISGLYARGIAAVNGPVDGLPGNVYQLSVYVPDPVSLAIQNPNFTGFKFPPQVGIKLVLGTVNSSNFDNSAMVSQSGIILNLK